MRCREVDSKELLKRWPMLEGLISQGPITLMDFTTSLSSVEKQELLTVKPNKDRKIIVFENNPQKWTSLKEGQGLADIKSKAPVTVLRIEKGGEIVMIYDIIPAGAV